MGKLKKPICHPLSKFNSFSILIENFSISSEPSNEIKAEVNEEQTESEELDLHLTDDEEDLINNINLEIQ